VHRIDTLGDQPFEPLRRSRCKEHRASISGDTQLEVGATMLTRHHKFGVENRDRCIGSPGQVGKFRLAVPDVLAEGVLRLYVVPSVMMRVR